MIVEYAADQGTRGPRRYGMFNRGDEANKKEKQAEIWGKFSK